MRACATALTGQNLGEPRNVRDEASSLSVGGPEGAIVGDDSLEIVDFLQLSYQGRPRPDR